MKKKNTYEKIKISTKIAAFAFPIAILALGAGALFITTLGTNTLAYEWINTPLIYQLTVMGPKGGIIIFLISVILAFASLLSVWKTRAVAEIDEKLNTGLQAAPMAEISAKPAKEEYDDLDEDDEDDYEAEKTPASKPAKPAKAEAPVKQYAPNKQEENAQSNTVPDYFISRDSSPFDNVLDDALDNASNEFDSDQEHINDVFANIQKQAEEKEAQEKAKREAEKAEAERKAKEEAERAEAEKRAQEEAARKAEEAKRIAEENAKRKAAEEAQRKAEEDRRRAEEEAKRKAEEEARRQAEEAQRKAAEEAQRKAEEARKAAEAEERARREQEEQIRKQREAEKAQRKAPVQDPEFTALLKKLPKDFNLNSFPKFYDPENKRIAHLNILGHYFIVHASGDVERDPIGAWQFLDESHKQIILEDGTIKNLK